MLVSLLAVAAASFAAGRWVRPAPAVPATPAVSAPAVAPVRPVAARPPPPSPAPVAEVASAAPVAEVRPAVPTPVDPAPAPVAVRPAVNSASIAAALGETDPVKRQLAFADLLRGLNAQNARLVAQALAGQGGDGRGRHELALVMDAWGQVDGPAAVAYGQEIGSEQATSSALSGWAAQYPEAARQWAMANSENPDNPWMIPVIAGTARANVDVALPMLYALPYGAARGRSLDYVIDAYARRGVDALASWVTGISDQRLREGAAARVAPRMAEEDPQRAAEWALKYAGTERQAQALVPVMATWARTAPADAVAWAEKLEPGRTHDLALEHVVGTWAHTDPAAAEAWLSRSGSGPSFDRARISIGMRYFESDPVRAMSWVSTVSDERMRNRMLERIAGAWTERDPAAASAFLGK